MALVARFCDWPSLTPISMVFQTVTWIVPAVRSVYILAVADRLLVNGSMIR